MEGTAARCRRRADLAAPHVVSREKIGKAREPGVALAHTVVRRERMGCHGVVPAFARPKASAALCLAEASRALVDGMAVAFWSRHSRWWYRQASLVSSLGIYDAVTFALRLEILSRRRHMPVTHPCRTSQRVRSLIIRYTLRMGDGSHWTAQSVASVASVTSACPSPQLRLLPWYLDSTSQRDLRHR